VILGDNEYMIICKDLILRNLDIEDNYEFTYKLETILQDTEVGIKKENYVYSFTQRVFYFAA
jgi:hypothetical protein